ncbi:M23 family metallopeptidase [Dorea sp. D27]|uniref:M23 family metallopeptidase n=1 Tax=Dorea sp. D27 TaxID=658665 RepID=UPI0006734E08|nr:M23 family metallopeptidase [Dorea sp. D27]KMZ54512.1 putative M23 peptidase domain protein [Dorea sp. D27]
MNKRQRPAKKRKGATAAVVVCFVAAIAIVGTYTFRDYRKTQEEQQLAQAEETDDTKEEKTEEPTETANNDLVINTTENDKQDESDSSDDTADGAAANENQNTQTTAGSGTSVHFTEDSQLLWPVNGNILMNYSMDKTVYFSTLDQYKYNPALVISGAEGDQVISAAPGIIKSIDVSAETGTTVNVDIGNGYELFYGQLKEVPVKVGDYVEAKSVLGYISQPTKYYSVEGSNVYFEMRKDGQPVNPMEYLAE